MLFEGSVDGEAAYAVEGVRPVEGGDTEGVVFGETALVVEELFAVMAGLHHRLQQVDGVSDDLSPPLIVVEGEGKQR